MIFNIKHINNKANFLLTHLDIVYVDINIRQIYYSFTILSILILFFTILLLFYILVYFGYILYIKYHFIIIK